MFKTKVYDAAAGINVIAVFLFVLILSAACGKDEPVKHPEEVYAVENIAAGGDAINEIIEKAAEISAVDNVNPAEFEKSITISWGINLNYNINHAGIGATGDKYYIPYESNKRGIFLNLERFYNTKVNPVIYEPDSATAARRKMPDIALTEPFNARLKGETRGIPREMIETYAPDYAGLLDLYDGWNINLLENGEYAGLSTFNAYNGQLSRFSLYRLDYLREIDYLPKGPLIELEENIFFCRDAFAHDEFQYIMHALSGRAATSKAALASAPGYNLNSIYGLSFDFTNRLNSTGYIKVPFDTHIGNIAPILGMYGVNSAVVNDNGRAVPFYAASQFKSALRDIANLSEKNIILPYADYVTGHEDGFSALGVVAWHSTSLKDLNAVISNIRKQEGAQVLITPPETGMDRQRGAGAGASSELFTPRESWVIGKDVSDEKLARILYIFNLLSFNKFSYMQARYGFREAGYQPGYAWEGEPFESAVIPNPPFIQGGVHWADGIGLLVMDVVDGVNVTRQIQHALMYKPLVDYLESDEAEGMVARPYNIDKWGPKHYQKAELDNRYAAEIELHLWNLIVLTAMAQYKNENFMRESYGKNFWAGYTGGDYMEALWDWHIKQLNDNGLEPYIDFYNQP